MSFLTVEMGGARRRGNSPPMPDQLAVRDDVTLAQKQRLAMLAKMGIGPVAASAERPIVQPQIRREPHRTPSGPPELDRRAALRERERKLREEEEERQRIEEQLEQEERVKKAQQRKSSSSGLQRLGPVMPREDDVLQFLPAPAPAPAPAPVVVPAPREAPPRVFAEADLESEDDDMEPGQAGDAEASILRLLRADRPKQWRQERQKKKEDPPRPQQQQPQKPGKKKRKKRANWEEDDGEEVQGEDAAAWEEEDEPDGEALRLAAAREHERRALREAKPMMVVESVKGKVSTANKHFTDADLERRFSSRDTERDSSLMTEEEVLRMIKKEKQERGTGALGSASRRVQRELAEWAAAKQQQRARVPSPHRFERMVVSRK